jgi:hypothetical protein
MQRRAQRTDSNQKGVSVEKEIEQGRRIFEETASSRQRLQIKQE